MRVKKVILNNCTTTLSVSSCGEWFHLQPALVFYENITKQKLEIISSVSSDLILFLQKYSEIKNDLETLISFLKENNFKQEDDYEEQKPFSPLSFRDFMLYEKHVVNASKGFVKRFMPQKLWMLELYEKLTGKNHPLLKPKPIWYEKPIYYMGSHLSFYKDNDKISYPSYSNMLDYELELGFIIAKPIKNASKDEALDAIGGFCIVNDFSARDVQLPEMKSGFGPVKSKNFANSLSSVIVTPDEILPCLNDLKTEVRINGKTCAKGNTSGMRYSLAEAIAYASKDEQIFPGELMATGTIPNCCGIENGVLLNPQDKVELIVDKIGTLTNFIGNKN